MALEHHAEPSVAWLKVVDDAPVNPDLAPVRLLEPGDQAQSCRLTAARWADKNDEFTVLDVEAEIAHRTDRAVGFGEVDEFDPGHAYLRTMPKLKPRARCLRIAMPTIISGKVMPTDSAA